MSDTTESPDRHHAQSEEAKQEAAQRESPRLARRGFDPELARNIAANDRGE